MERLKSLTNIFCSSKFKFPKKVYSNTSIKDQVNFYDSNNQNLCFFNKLKIAKNIKIYFICPL